MISSRVYRRIINSLRRRILEVEEAGANLKEQKRELIQGLPWSTDKLLKFIADKEIPLVMHLKAEIPKIVNREEELLEAAKEEGEEDIAALLFGFLKKISVQFRILRRILVSEESELQTRKIEIFNNLRVQEENVIREIDKQVGIIVQRANMRHVVDMHDASVARAERIFSRRLSPIATAAAALLILLSALRPVYAQNTIFVHHVSSGEHIGTIYNWYKGVYPSWAAVKQANPGVDFEHLKPGQQINIPVREGAKAPREKQNKYDHPSDNFRDEDQVITLTRFLIGEGEGCNEASLKALGSLVRYRLWSLDFPNNVHDVLTPDQFHCFMRGNAQYNKVHFPLRYMTEAEFNRYYRIAAYIMSTRTLSIHPAFFYHDNSMGSLGPDYVRVAIVENGKPNGAFHFYVAKNNKLSANFRVREFLFPGCKAILVDPSLIRRLEQVRAAAGNRPTTIVGIHKQGSIVFVDAVNIVVKSLTAKQMQALAQQLGLPMKNGAIHVQIGGSYIASDVDPKTGQEPGAGQVAKEQADVQNVGFVFPLKTFSRISSKFGPRIHPTTGKRSMHNGIDIAAPEGTPVFAIGKGTVWAVNHNSRTAGKLVIIQHPNGFMSEYMHMHSIMVKNGQVVDENTIIGQVGSTGRSSGPHLHIGVFKGQGSAGYRARKSNFVDPLTVLSNR